MNRNTAVNQNVVNREICISACSQSMTCSFTITGLFERPHQTTQPMPFIPLLLVYRHPEQSSVLRSQSDKAKVGKFEEEHLQVVTRVLLSKQALIDRSVAFTVLFFVLKIVKALDVAQLQAGIDMLSLNSIALEQLKQSSELFKAVLELAILFAVLLPSGLQLADALRAVKLQPLVWKTSFPALAPEFDKHVQALNHKSSLQVLPVNCMLVSRFGDY